MFFQILRSRPFCEKFDFDYFYTLVKTRRGDVVREALVIFLECLGSDPVRPLNINTNVHRNSFKAFLKVAKATVFF